MSLQKQSSLNSQQSQEDHLLKVFNTALVSTLADGDKDTSETLQELMKSPAFQVILRATRYLAEHQQWSEKEAAESLISTFRKMDTLWKQFVFQQGIERIKKPAPVQRPARDFGDDF